MTEWLRTLDLGVRVSGFDFRSRLCLQESWLVHQLYLPPVWLVQVKYVEFGEKRSFIRDKPVQEPLYRVYQKNVYLNLGPSIQYFPIHVNKDFIVCC